MAQHPVFEIKCPPEELRKRKLMVVTPMYGGMCAGMFCKSMCDLTQLCFYYGIEMSVHQLYNESLITRARNYCVDTFLQSDKTHMLFIDSDIGFDANDMIGLLAMQSDDSPYDIIGAPYPKKCISWEKIKVAVDKGFADEHPDNLARYVGDYVFNPVPGTTEIPLFSPCQVLEIGTGCMMVRRKTFEKFQEAYPQYWYRPDHVRTAQFDGSRKIMQYFQAEIDTVDYATEYQEGLKALLAKMEADDMYPREALAQEIETLQKAIAAKADKKSLRYLSEDYWFCQRINEIGLQTWLCPWMKLQHVGTYIFGGSLPDIAQVQVSPTADPSMLKKPR